MPRIINEGNLNPCQVAYQMAEMYGMVLAIAQGIVLALFHPEGAVSPPDFFIQAIREGFGDFEQ